MKTVIEMAREIWSAGEVYVASEKNLERFAELVRADAIADEREACAKAADDQWVRNPNVSGGDAIRARSKNEDRN